MNRFDLSHCPLRGVHLIDASAGTGKTYAISGLVLRLLLEEELRISEILVVTYTEAAADDMRSRIREKIIDALRVFAGGETNESFLIKLSEQFRHRTANCMTLLKAGLRDYDEASVLTIHGFCRRLLHENTLESGTLFEVELEKDLQYLLDEIVWDFYRKHFYQASPLFAEYGRRQFEAPRVSALLGQHMLRRDITIIPNGDGAICQEVSSREAAYAEVYERLRNAWHQERDTVQEILFSDDAGLNRTRYPVRKISGWIAELDRLMGAPRPVLHLFENFGKFSAEVVASAMKKGCAAPENSFFHLCDHFLTVRETVIGIFDACLLSMTIDLVDYVRKEFEIRKTKKRIHSFDDLLNRVRAALDGEGGEDFASFVSSQYPVALIDEFQDTDPVQYEIFSRIYRGANRESGLFLMIGDPKQAIYSFRGADIFTYMNAAGKVDGGLTLDVNWRSEPRLVKAVNAIFTSPPRPFIFNRIVMNGVNAVEGESPPLLIQGEHHPPLQMWFVSRQGDQLRDSETKAKAPLIAKKDARERILRSVSSEIHKLISLGREGQATIGDHPLLASDIAVLVRTNHEARQTQKALELRGIVSVIHSQEYIFATHEAEEFERILLAVVDFRNERRLRAALVTDAIGKSGEFLDTASEDVMQDFFLGMEQYNYLWNSSGFVVMINQIMSDYGVRSRLLKYPEGERRLTNMLHLVEILHKQILEHHLGMHGAMKFLSDRLNSEVFDEEYQLRLESDRDCVRIVTVHKAKGLQYPVVFCPFLWGGPRKVTGKSGSPQSPVLFHSPKEDGRLVLDMGSPEFEANRDLALIEELAENIRIFYVALTRAQARCYLVWGGIRSCELSAPGYLFHQRGQGTVHEVIQTTADRIRTMEDNEMLDDLDALVAASDNTLAVSRMIEEEGKSEITPEPDIPVLECRNFRRGLEDTWRIMSFSSLIQSRPRLQERPDFDEADLPETRNEVVDTSLSKYTFPHGAGPGTFLHTVFEKMDFNVQATDQRESLIREQLETFGFDGKWQGVVNDMVKNVVETPLTAGDQEFTLSKISLPQRLNELEFHFPLAPITLQKALEVLTTHQGFTEQFGSTIRPDSSGYSTVRGFMKGYIDLIFEYKGKYYIVDWKSNYLGSHPEDYHWKKLIRVMGEEYYFLQYYIYTVALDLFLRNRIRDYSYSRHFGGVFYMFLRGVEKSKGWQYGIFHDIPDEVLIREFSKALVS
ncbi:exodeoxyribonuclease V subunit beta [Thermodesulfobacteriota bacterium]